MAEETERGTQLKNKSAWKARDKGTVLIANAHSDWSSINNQFSVLVCATIIILTSSSNVLLERGF